MHLRKVAQHPLLVRSWYTDAMVQDIAGIAHKRCGKFTLTLPATLEGDTCCWSCCHTHDNSANGRVASSKLCRFGL